MRKKKLKRRFNMQKSMAGELRWAVVMLGEKSIAPKMIKNVGVVNFVYPVSGVHPETQRITPDKLKG